ncbi:MAG: metal ABC transporter ATP-binding protein [Gammaproteobacteria bacterium]|jgi:zinc transport system ATP-binding protein|nr:metal ABC transporter ATP-binding protein [Gammaproteobacteria bacterium]
MLKENDPLISLEDAGIFRADRWLVRDVSMSVSRGEIVTLIGPNGSGKSTTAKLTLGVLKTDEGKVYRRPNLRVSYVPQKLDLNWTLPLSVTRFLILTNRASNKQIENALALTDTLHLANAQMRNLSGGEFQRVLLARAILRSPDFLVLDEPVQGVDFNGEIALYKLIEDIRNKLNCGVLLISHDLHVVMSATDKVICLNGHVCCSGTPATVASSDEFKSLFGKQTALGLAFYQHRHDHEHLPDGRILTASVAEENSDV